MGLKSGIELVKKITSETRLSIFSPTCLSIDCLILMHKNLILNDDGSPNVEFTIRSTIKFIENHLASFFIHQANQINSIKLFVDGKSPYMKALTQQLRRDAAANDFPKTKLIECFIENIKKRDSKICSVDCEIIRDGESEFTMFHKRDPEMSNILWSDDSDLMVMCMKYQQLHPNDFVFIYSKKKSYFPGDIDSNLPRSYLILLFSTLGTDFNTNCFTPTMVKTILDYFSVKNNNFIQNEKQIENENDVKNVLVDFCSIIQDSGSRSYFPKKDSTNSNFEFDLYLQNLFWTYSYYTQGKSLDGCNCVNINKHEFLKFICKKMFETKKSSSTTKKAKRMKINEVDFCNNFAENWRSESNMNWRLKSEV